MVFHKEWIMYIVMRSAELNSGTALVNGDIVSEHMSLERALRKIQRSGESDLVIVQWSKKVNGYVLVRF